MGKNPNASRQKKNHRKNQDDSDPEDRMAQLAEEAAKLGCEVWEVEKVKAQMADNSDSDSEEESKVEPEKKEIPKTLPKEESEEENDSADDELEKMFGPPNKKG